jgi:hypothetical protein
MMMRNLVNLYYFHNISRVITSRRMRWTESVARTTIDDEYKLLVQNLKGTLLDVGRSKEFMKDLKKCDLNVYTGFKWITVWSSDGPLRIVMQFGIA